MIAETPAFFDMYYTKEDGKLTTEGQFYNDQMFQTLNLIVLLLNSLSTTDIRNGVVTVQGLIPPSYTTTEIVALEPTAVDGTIWRNSTLKKLQFKADSGVIETITSS